MDSADCKAALSKGTCFIENYYIGFGKSLYVVSALNKNTAAGSPAYAAEKDRGTEITRAQGQDTTRNMRALLSHSVILCLSIKGGIKASSTAAITTQGV